MRRTLRVGDRGSDKPACVPSKSVSPLKRREKDGLVTSGRARRHDAQQRRVGVLGGRGGQRVVLGLKSISKLPRHANMLGGEGPALHNMLFHLAGGGDTELKPPPAKGDDKLVSKHVMEYAKKQYGELWREKCVVA